MESKIMIIEPNQTMRLFLFNYLGHYYRVEAYGSLEDLSKVEKFDQPDLVLYTITDKDDTYIKTHLVLRNSAIIALTNEDNSEERIKALRMNANDSISKPFSPEELKIRIKVAIRNREARSKNKSSILAV
ncbi:response regulator [Reichenbachiella versicolor]|uniref:response regulator n=1 Tax=Reichenbachiella versicolor TaxID=1821036 RepID=UPI0013A59AA1|nr:response regulator [Reichenbachiella versicolor]